MSLAFYHISRVLYSSKEGGEGEREREKEREGANLNIHLVFPIF